jgi:hypothetical protein
MDIGKRALILATALVLGMAILGLTAEYAAAESKKPKDNGVRCHMPGDIVVPPTGNDHEFFAPGDWAEAKAGPDKTAMYECQADGTWKQVMRTEPRLQGRVPSGTFTQTP